MPNAGSEKIRALWKDKRQKDKEEYYRNPKRCMQCNLVIELPEDKMSSFLKEKRFCSRSCGSRFHMQKRSTDGLALCQYCQKDFNGSNGKLNHERFCKKNPNKEKSPIIEYHRIVNKPKGRNQFSNPDFIIASETRDRLSRALKGKKHSEDTKRLISDKLRIAHAEGRAWNIGKSRWNNKPSYPERFFIRVIETSFMDKSYIREFNVGIYSIDFAWPEKKKAIEIDGEQHFISDEAIKRDCRKTETLLNDGWRLFRIRWKYMFKHPQVWILLARRFIGP